MKNNTWYELLKEWKSFLSENIKLSDDSEIKSYVERLKNLTLDFKNQCEGDDYEYYINRTDLLYQQLENILYHDSISKMGEGESRVGYSFKDKPWVLKLAKSVKGAEDNKRELDIHQRKHGQGASDIFVNLYYWDDVNEDPWWVISEKVKPLSEIEDIEVLKNVFPTFWNILDHGDNNIVKSSAKNFREFVVKTISSCVYEARLPKKKQNIYRNADEAKYREMLMFNRNYPEKQGKDVARDKLKKVTSNFDNSGKLDKTLPKISNMMFHDAAMNFSNVKDIEEVTFYEDFERLSKAFGYVTTSDMHDDKFGIRLVNRPGPADIVILDFDINI